MSPAEIESKALKLKPSARARLAERLLRSLEELSPDEIDQLWADEALRRHRELEAGTEKPRPGRAVLRAAKSRLR